MASQVPPNLDEYSVKSILDLAGPAELKALRHASKHYWKVTSKLFALEFDTIKSDLSQKHLQDILDSEELATHVQCLRIIRTEEGLGKGFEWPRDPDSGALKEKLGGANLLQKILHERLVKCRSIRIDAYEDVGKGRGSDTIAPSDAVGLTLSIVAENGWALRSLMIQSDWVKTGKIDTPEIDIHLAQAARFTGIWTGMEELVFDFAITPDQCACVLAIISSTTQLQRLSLAFHRSDHAFTEKLSNIRTLTKLKELNFAHAHLKRNDIELLLQNNRDTLQSVSLFYTTFSPRGEWKVFLASLCDQISKFPNFQHLQLLELRETSGRIKLPGMLQYLTMDSESQEKALISGCICDIRQIPSVQKPVMLFKEERSLAPIGIEYHGEQMGLLLETLVASLQLPQRQRAPKVQ